MVNQDSSIFINKEDFNQRILSLEQRVAMLEAEIAGGRKLVPNSKDESQEDDSAELNLNGVSIESSFGEYGLAWLGNVVLLLGIVFFVKFLQNKGLTLLSPLIGYVATAALFLVSRYLRQSNQNLASIFRLTAYLLLYIITLQLHFFTNQPLITSIYVTLIFLSVVIIFQAFVAIRKRSQGLAALAFIMAGITAVVSDLTHFMLPLTVLISLAAVYFMSRFGWWRLLIFSIFLVYFIHLGWMLGNPFMGHTMKAITLHQSGYIYLFFVAASYSGIAMIKKREDLFPDYGIVSSIVINGLGFSFMISLFVLTFFKNDYVILFSVIALSCLLYSIFLQSRSEWKVTASLYALYSFVALSVSVFGIYGLPQAYFLLALQSLLVVSMALWFRSRVIVIMNTMLFAVLLIAYLSTGQESHSANISFALVSLITARILNWQKERLKITTELLRNCYLIIGFVMVLLSLYRIVPGNYVTLSWTMAAALYFVLSIVLKNIKYRYLALGTMGATALYLFIVDLARVEILYRVMAFFFLAVISITLSIYYTRKRSKKADQSATE